MGYPPRLRFTEEDRLLRLVPDVCRDCGVSAQSVELSPYLDFRLCPDCIRARERALFADLPRRTPKAEPKSRKVKAKAKVKPKSNAKAARKQAKPQPKKRKASAKPTRPTKKR